MNGQPTTDNTWLPMFGACEAPQSRSHRLEQHAKSRPTMTSGTRTVRPLLDATRPADIAATRPQKLTKSQDQEVSIEYDLTSAEHGVLRLLADGLSNVEIAGARDCAVGTVKVHLVRLFRKLGVRNRTEAARVGQRLRELELWRRQPDPNPLQRWLSMATSEFRSPGETLFRIGDPGDALYFIQDGRVELPELRVTLEKGAVFGEIGVFSLNGRRTATARCSTKTVLFRLGASQAQRLYLTDPMFARSVMELVSQRVAEERLHRAA